MCTRQVKGPSLALAQGCDSGEGKTSSQTPICCLAPPFDSTYQARMHLPSRLYRQHLAGSTCQVRYLRPFARRYDPRGEVVHRRKDRFFEPLSPI